MGGSMIERIHGWLRKPYSDDMDALHWVLFLGLVLIITFLWSRIMAHLTAE